MRSIQTRLAGGLSLSLILLLTVQWIVVGVSIRKLTESYIATHLVQDSETLLASLFLSDNSDINLNKTKLGLVFSQPFSGQYYKVSVADKEFRSRSLWDTDLTHAAANSQRNIQTIVAGPQQQTLLQITSRYTKNSKLIVISVAEDLSPIYKDITAFQIRYGIMTLVVAFILLVTQAFIINKNLKPLDKIRKELKLLDKGIISQLQENVPTEVLPLIRELNQQLKVFSLRLERSRNATGNLAHALKTPLSLLYQLTDDPWIQQNKNIRASLLQSIKTIEENINRELKRAQIAGVKFAARQSSLEPEIKSLLKTLRTIYQEKKLHIHYKIPDGMLCNMDRQDLLEMLGNVLDNACKWAKNEVLLTIKVREKSKNIKNGRNNGELIFIVEDDGSGCTSDEMSQLTTRGIRLDEQTSGSGLGMSIVQGIVKDYIGQLDISRSKKLGGLCVQINIPFPGYQENDLSDKVDPDPV
ncbi:MAG: sensor histidine kinase [Thiohalomonadales bacterium]